MLKDIFDSEIGRILVSIILGLGLAAVFRKVCTGNNCIIIKGPNVEEVQKYYYKIDNDCFKYTPVVTSCESSLVNSEINSEIKSEKI